MYSCIRNRSTRQELNWSRLQGLCGFLFLMMIRVPWGSQVNARRVFGTRETAKVPQTWMFDFLQVNLKQVVP